MVGFRNLHPVRHRWLLRLVALGGVASIVAGVYLWHAVELHSLATVAEQVEEAKPVAGAVRVALIGALALLWPRLTALVPAGKGNEGDRVRWTALRWRVVGWLLTIELVLGHNLPGHLPGG